MVGRPGTRTWRHALLLAALTLYVPVMMPVLLGMLRDCGHCATQYWLSAPVVPGVLVSLLLGLDDAWFFLVAGAVTAALFGVLALAMRELPLPWSAAVQAPAIGFVGLQAIGFAAALRA
jgi:hypothetical protein